MKELNWGQKELAAKAHVSQSTVNRILNSPTSNRLDTIQRVASALGRPLEYFTTADEKKRSYVCPSHK